MLHITSPANPRLKSLLKLREARARKENGQFLVEGSRELHLAMAGGTRLIELYYCDPLLRADARVTLQTIADGGRTGQSVPIISLSRECFAKAAMRDDSDGLLGVFAADQGLSLGRLTQEQAARLAASPVLVIAGVEKPGNIGAMLRSADGLGFRWVILCDCPGDIYNPNLIRASLGTVFALNIVTADSAGQVITFLHGVGIKPHALALTEAAVDIFSIDFSDPASRGDHGRPGPALVVGSEDKGLGQDWLGDTSQQVMIPMLGQADSLNVAATAAIAMALVRKSRGPTKADPLPGHG